jgi:DnaK suppressor protein
MTGARGRLDRERREAAQRLVELTGSFEDFVAASRDSNADDEHDPEGATIAYERAQVVALAHQVREHLDQIDAALERLDAGTYGRCETCGGTIGEARLEARPTAVRCITCAQKSRRA